LEEANHGQNNSILPRHGQLVLEVHIKILGDDEITFNLIKKEFSFEWKKEQHRAFENLKNMFLSTLC
jgi:hypothetical protein